MSGTRRGRGAVMPRRGSTSTRRGPRPRPIPASVADALADAADAANVCRDAQSEAVAAIARRDDLIAAATASGASRRQVAAATGLSLAQVHTIVAREAGSVTP